MTIHVYIMLVGIATDIYSHVTVDWLKACQSFMTLSMFVLLGAIGVVGAYAFIPDMEGDVRMLTACLIVTGTASEYYDTFFPDENLCR